MASQLESIPEDSHYFEWRSRHQIKLDKRDYMQFLEEEGLSDESSDGSPLSSLTSSDDEVPVFLGVEAEATPGNTKDGLSRPALVTLGPVELLPLSRMQVGSGVDEAAPVATGIAAEVLL